MQVTTRTTTTTSIYYQTQHQNKTTNPIYDNTHIYLLPDRLSPKGSPEALHEKGALLKLIRIVKIQYIKSKSPPPLNQSLPQPTLPLAVSIPPTPLHKHETMQPNKTRTTFVDRDERQIRLYHSDKASRQIIVGKIGRQRDDSEDRIKVKNGIVQGYVRGKIEKEKKEEKKKRKKKVHVYV